MSIVDNGDGKSEGIGIYYKPLYIKNGFICKSVYEVTVKFKNGICELKDKLCYLKLIPKN